MRRGLAVLGSVLVVLALAVAGAPTAAAAQLPPGDYLWVTTTTQTLVYDRSQQPKPTLVAETDNNPTGGPVRVVNQGGAVVLVPTSTGIDVFIQRLAQRVSSYSASPNGYQQVVAYRGEYAATIPTVYGLRTGGRVIDVWGGDGSLETSITLPGPASYMSPPRPTTGDVIVLGSIKRDSDGQYVSAVINTADNSVRYLNAGTRQVVNGAVWSPDGTRAYLSATNLDSSTGSIVTFTTEHGFTNTAMPSGVTPQQIAVSADGSRLFLPSTSASGSALQAIDTSTLERAASVPLAVGAGAGAPTYSPDGKVYLPPGPQGLGGSIPFYDTRGAVGVLDLGLDSPVVGALAADLPSAIRVDSGANQKTYVDAPFVAPVVVSVLDPAGTPLPDQLVRFVDDDANAHFRDCSICLTYTGPDGKATSPPIIAEGTVGPAHILVMVDQLPTVTVPLTVLPAAVPPTVTALTAGDRQVVVAFTPGDDRGVAPPTSFTVQATDLTTPSNGGQTHTGKGSPITVTELTNGDTYTFTVTANTAVGNWQSAPSQRINVGIPAGITGTPPPAEVGKPYQFRFTVTGAPPPAVRFDNDATPLPDGLSFDTSTATISGTPTAAGSFFLAFYADNAVGSASNTPTLVVNPASALGSPPPTTPAATTPAATGPPTGAPAAAPIAASSGSSARYASSGRALAATGMPVDRLVGSAVALVVLGGALLLLARRRKA
jgi:hypothetical protein